MRLPVLLFVVFASCKPEHSRDAPVALETLALTHYTDKTELFVEFGTLVVATPSKFAAHVTRLSDFQPEDKARVTVELAIGATIERALVDTARIPGIFGPVLTPARAGIGKLALIVTTAAGDDRHELGNVTVYGTASDAPAAEESGLATISYLKEQQWTRPFATEPVAARPFYPVVFANGELKPRPEDDARVAAPVGGRLVQLGLGFPRLGDEVKQHQPLAGLAPKLSSEVDLATLRLRVREAELRSNAARTDRERLTALSASGAVSERRVLAGQREEAEATASVEAARSRLAQFEGTQRTLAPDASRLALRSPIQGTIVEARHAPGALVREGDEVFRVVALDRLWLEARIFEGDVGRVLGAESGRFTVDGYDGFFELSSTSAKRVALGGMVDERTRTVPLVFEVTNPRRALRVGMFARVYLFVGTPTPAITVPRAAIVSDQGTDVVYVLVEGESFARRRVTLGPTDGERVEVKAGLTEGERVVTVGANDIRLAASAAGAPVHGHEH